MNANPNRLGQINLAGDPQAMFLKVFSGLVQNVYDRATIYSDKVLNRTIPFGKSAQFPTTGLAGVRYHTPGAEITGQTLPMAEKNILLDDLLISDLFIAYIDELMNHFEVRSNYAHQMGQALARFDDQNISRIITNAARAAATVTGGFAGSQITDADLATDGQKVWAAVFNAGVGLDQKDIPQDGRYAILDPVRYALALRSEKPINTDLNPGGNGSLATGRMFLINDIPLLKTNNMAQANDFSGFGGGVNPQMPAGRQHDYSPTIGQVFHRSAAGTVSLQGLTMQMMEDIRRQGHLMIGKFLKGYGDLRPEGAYELRIAAPAG